MDLLESTYGPMLWEFLMITTTLHITVHVLNIQVHLLLCLQRTTIIVSQGRLEHMISHLFTLMTLCGTERVVVLVTTAVHNLECPDSVVLYHRKWRGTLKCVCVLILVPMMRTCIWRFWRSTFSNELMKGMHYLYASYGHVCNQIILCTTNSFMILKWK